MEQGEENKFASLICCYQDKLYLRKVTFFQAEPFELAQVEL